MFYYTKAGETFDDFCPDSQKVNEYISKISTVKIDKVIIDTEAILGVRWDCPSTCGLRCCDGGGGILIPNSEYEVNKYIHLLENHLVPEQYSVLHAGKFTTQKYKMNEFKGACIFYSHKEITGYCSLHRAAIENGLPVFDLKSFECCIEPLEIIVLDNENIFLTVATPDTVSFVRWKTLLPCMESSRNKQHPYIYQSMKDVLVYIFGSGFYDELSCLANTRMRSNI